MPIGLRVGFMLHLRPIWSQSNVFIRTTPVSPAQKTGTRAGPARSGRRRDTVGPCQSSINRWQTAISPRLAAKNAKTKPTKTKSFIEVPPQRSTLVKVYHRARQSGDKKTRREVKKVSRGATGAGRVLSNKHETALPEQGCLEVRYKLSNYPGQ